MNIEYYMKQAIEVAKKSGEDIPIGCIIVYKNKIIAKACNKKEKNNDPTAHSEIIALRQAGKYLNKWRLDNCDLYVTLEPCPMCAWAIINSGIEKIYFGTYDLNYGALGSKINLIQYSTRKPQIYGGILEKETKEIISDYFKQIRKK